MRRAIGRKIDVNNNCAISNHLYTPIRLILKTFNIPVLKKRKYEPKTQEKKIQCVI